MERLRTHRLLRLLPISASAALVLTACGSDSDSSSTPIVQGQTEQAPAAVTENAPAAGDAGTQGQNATTGAPAVKSNSANKAKGVAEKALTNRQGASSAQNSNAAAGKTGETTKVVGRQSASDKAADQKIYEQKSGATDVGVTKDSIKLGSINMHGMPLGNLAVQPMIRGNLAAASAINDRGGILGRRITITDCDDGPGEVSRAKACLKKLVTQDKIFSLISAVDWATASIHDDLKQFNLPYFGSWGYSQTEWQDPYMFPTHMSMIHEAMAGANWARNVIKPKTYGMICLTSPEMQLACNEVQKIMDASGSKLVKKVDVAISEASMSSYVLSMRAANPEHIVHYVINPATVAKFLVESAQQGYYPPKGISGNHMAMEVLGSLIGKHPAGRYWTNTTYKLWGPQYMATMARYARGNKGLNHHIVQAGYVGVNIFAEAGKQVGPNLTRDRMRAAWANGTVWKADASLDQQFAYTRAERGGSHGNQTWSKNLGQGREYMYKYTGTNTTANPDGAPNGYEPDPDQFVIHTWK